MAGPFSTNDEGFRILQDKFHQLGWDNPHSKPSIAVELADDRSLTMRLSTDSTNDHSELIAVRIEPGAMYGKTTTTSVRRSPPLKDAEQALSLLRSNAKGDGEFESLVEWVEQ